MIMFYRLLLRNGKSQGIGIYASKNKSEIPHQRAKIRQVGGGAPPGGGGGGVVIFFYQKSMHIQVAIFRVTRKGGL